MNQRIRELTKQAISDVDYIRDDDFTNEELSKMYIPDCFAEKFAELIVRECAKLADDGFASSNFGNGITGHQLLKHFGVEE